MRLHLALCLLCAAAEAQRKARGPELLYENASCEGSDQGAYLGTPASVDECAVSAAAAGCDMFMFSESYGYSWGCRCCSAKTQYHDNWSIYSVDSKNSQRTTPRPTSAPTPTVTDANVTDAQREPAPASATAAKRALFDIQCDGVTGAGNKFTATGRLVLGKDI